MFINSVLAVILWLWVRACLRHIRESVPRSERSVEGVLMAINVTRRALTLYTISASLYITARAALELNSPTLGDKWFPWV